MVILTSLIFMSCFATLPVSSIIQSIPQNQGTRGQNSVFPLGQPWSESLEPGFRPGEIRLSWKPEALIVEANLTDDEVFNQATRDNQRMWELGDVFEIFLMIEGRKDYIELHVTPQNHRLHLHFPGVGGRPTPGAEPFPFEKMLTSPPSFRSTTRKTEKGWAVSAAIPPAVLGLKNFENGQVLRVSFCRYDAATNRPPVLSTSSPHSQIAFHRPDEWLAVRLD